MGKHRNYVCSGLAFVSCLLAGTFYGGKRDVTLNGQYVWERGQYFWERNDNDRPGDVKAIFTPAGDDAWDVVFQFDWDDEMRAWKGSATGSLENGSLKGEAVEDRDRERTFAFRGNVKDGVFTGEHGSEHSGQWRKSGPLTLK